MKKYYWPVYFIVTAMSSLWTHYNATSFSQFLVGSLATFVFFIGIYFCVRKIQFQKLIWKIIRIICVALLIALVVASWVWAGFYGFHSSYCYNLVAKDIFTGKISTHCNYPAWHTKIIGGEEARIILLENCLSRKSEFYVKNPTYCDVYKNTTGNHDWTKVNP